VTDEIVFYTNPMSRGRMVRWLLEELGQPYRTELLDYGPPMRTPEYLAINPMGKVPAIRHGETVVTECPAIMVYLAETFPEAGLAPRSSAERGPFFRWLFFAAGPLEHAVVDRVIGAEVPEDKRGMVGYGTYERALDALQQGVQANPYIAGERFTAADVYVGAQIGWGMRFGTLEKRPGFADYWGRLSAREAYVRAMALDDAAMPQEA